MTKTDQVAYLRTISALLKLLPEGTCEALLAETIRSNASNLNKCDVARWSVDQTRRWVEIGGWTQ